MTATSTNPTKMSDRVRQWTANDCGCSMCAELIPAADALDAAEREPDEAMLMAGARSIRDTMSEHNFVERARQCYAAMQSAKLRGEKVSGDDK